MEKEILIRRGVPADAEAIEVIWRSRNIPRRDGFLRTEPSFEEIRRELREEDIPYLVAALDGNVVGFVSYGLDLSYIRESLDLAMPGLLDMEHCYVHILAVAPEFSGRGIGGELYQELLRITGLPLLCCVVVAPEPNRGSMAFHQKNHFTAVGMSQGKTLLRVVLRLAPASDTK
jgi:ribosomal protein S18 acetylase RimI-like enzyme